MEVAIYDEATGELIVRQATPAETAAWEKQKAEAIINDPKNA
jgi:hypothetical protein